MIYRILCVLSVISMTYASSGDQSLFFEKCTEKCVVLNCTDDGLSYLNEIQVQPFYNKLLFWDCASECQYECMWKTTFVFERRNWRIPQFYGKWPFVRILGVQEPASVAFSLLNLYVHYVWFRRFKSLVRGGAPLYWLWHCYSAVCMNAWIWSTVFHTRDLPFTEFMDYTCATSVLVINFYCMLRRLLLGTSKFVTLVLSSFFAAFYINHVIYLSYGGFDYGYNLKVNILFGALSVISWFAWCLWSRKKQPYLWKLAAYVSLTALCTGLEVFDFAPVLWTFDSHSLWHLSTAVICPLFYSFIIDDSIYLRKQRFVEEKKQL